MKQIIISYDEYLKLENIKEELNKELEKIKEKNNYDFLIEFINEYESKLLYKDIKGKDYGSDEYKEILLPMSELYDIAKKRINNKILGEDND